MSTAYSTSSLAGMTLDGIEPTQVNLGMELTDSLGRKRRLVASTATALSPCAVVSITSANVASAITPALAINAAILGVVPQSVSTSATQNFWAILSGPTKVTVAVNCQPNVPLYTTDTAGVLDDATVSLSQFQIMGLEVDTGNSNSAAAASNLPCTLNNILVRHPKQGP